MPHASVRLAIGPPSPPCYTEDGVLSTLGEGEIACASYTILGAGTGGQRLSDMGGGDPRAE